jgi:NAD(P)H dehydrogenase (quinone)
MVRVTIVYHSGFGHTARLAQAVQRGAASVAGTEVTLVPVGDIEKHWNDLHSADAILFGCPTYMGSASAPFKAFMDSTSKFWMEQKWKDKIAGGFTNSAGPSGDKLSTLQQLVVFAMQHGMVWVGLGLMPAPSKKHPGQETNHLSAYLGAMSRSPMGAPDDVAPPAGDLETGELLGARVARAAARWKLGTKAATEAAATPVHGAAPAIQPASRS